MIFETPAQGEVWQAVREINRAWSEGRADDLTEFFREDMVMAPLGLDMRLVGREACIDSYRDFCSKATVHELLETAPAVDVFGDTAVAAYSWQVSYELNGESFEDTGQEVFVFLREEGKWWAVWRTIVPSAQG